MYSESELKVVKDHKVWGFAAYLQGAWSDFPRLESDLNERNYPTRDHVIEMLDRMERKRREFDFQYDDLSMVAVNPLQIEQEAWKLLSPRVADYLGRFTQFLDSYSQEAITDDSREEFLALEREGWDILQKWNTISSPIIQNMKWLFMVKQCGLMQTFKKGKKQ